MIVQMEPITTHDRSPIPAFCERGVCGIITEADLVNPFATARVKSPGTSPSSDTRQLRDLRSVGAATLEDFKLLGITTVASLRKRDARDLYQRLCAITGF